MPSVTHRIKITASDRGYSTTGAVAINCASNPMFAAASALLELGANASDLLRGVFEGAQISPVSLAAITKPRRIPRVDLRPSARNVD